MSRPAWEQSLRRLNTDYLDVVQVHGNPTRKELEDGGVIDALLKLQRLGAVRHLGISSRLPRLAEFVDADYFSLIQAPYSALQRMTKTSSARFGLSVKPLSPEASPAEARRPKAGLLARLERPTEKFVNSGSGRAR